MSGNDFAEFFPLEPSITAYEPAFPEVFISSGQQEASGEFDNLTPSVYKGSGAYRTATEFTNLTPAIFKYETPKAVEPVVYRMRGYYIGGSTYEFWTTSNPNAPNPSGNPLVDKVIDSVFC